ncbi:hypothetical protein [Streptomyces collinus]|uniref:hypothetical protein n=1 Tax=Streptomyces collinus TaxID=42684 RepID=UPI0033D9D1E4
MIYEPESGQIRPSRHPSYAQATGRGCIGSVDANNDLADVTVIPNGGFATDWTQITFPRPPGKL